MEDHINMELKSRATMKEGPNQPVQVEDPLDQVLAMSAILIYYWRNSPRSTPTLIGLMFQPMTGETILKPPQINIRISNSWIHSLSKTI